MNPTSPLRHPDASSAPVMTRRGWWLVLMNVLLPGSVQVVAGNRRLGRVGLIATGLLWLLAIIALVVYLVAPATIYTFATQAGSLTVLQIVLVLYAVLWVVLTLDTLRLVRLVKTTSRARGLIAAFAVVVLVGLTGTAGYASVVAGSARGALGDIFSAGPSEPPVDGRYNIMLLGGDAGPDRDGLRPDSMSVVSIDASTGKAVTIGLPRDLDPVPFPEKSPLHTLYPDGYGYEDRCDVDVCQLNSIYTEVETYKKDLYPNATKNKSEPGIEAMRDALEGATGLTIQYYVLIDMQGFADLVDALGGVDITVTDRIPIGGDEDLNGVVEWIEPGQHHMDGYHAQWYARARHGSSDYDRMARQRQLQDAILKQVNPVNVVSKFEGIAKAGSQVMKTDIPQSMLGYFVDLGMKTRKLPVDQLELVPPTIDPTDPDYTQIHQLVQQAVAPASPKPTAK
ncbi:LCP family protein [Leifsonia aquatica]|uniref:LCP family protein required for cell wall assembly n=2 Tax=Leifsonia aquatica TaxID=144185 RepID=A0A7W4YHH4_LEIAQ|nr:LCP family protein [Leifsonia aquatica]MBB2965437.1 LCP family protein required for cell wall assembly [Leifsonia aquatica]